MIKMFVQLLLGVREHEFNMQTKMHKAFLENLSTLKLKYRNNVMGTSYSRKKLYFVLL